MDLDKELSNPLTKATTSIPETIVEEEVLSNEEEQEDTQVALIEEEQALNEQERILAIRKLQMKLKKAYVLNKEKLEEVGITNILQINKLSLEDLLAYSEIYDLMSYKKSHETIIGKVFETTNEFIGNFFGIKVKYLNNDEEMKNALMNSPISSYLFGLSDYYQSAILYATGVYNSYIKSKKEATQNTLNNGPRIETIQATQH